MLFLEDSLSPVKRLEFLDCLASADPFLDDIVLKSSTYLFLSDGLIRLGSRSLSCRQQVGLQAFVRL